MSDKQWALMCLGAVGVGWVSMLGAHHYNQHWYETNCTPVQTLDRLYRPTYVVYDCVDGETYEVVSYE